MNVKTNQGFSLIEVLISLLLLSLTIFAYLNFQQKISSWQRSSQLSYLQQVNANNASA